MNRRAQPWLGTLVDISIRDQLDRARIQASFGLAFERIATVHRLMSFHDPLSDVARINHAGVGALIDIDPHTARVLATAIGLMQASGSIFHVGCGAALAIWGLLPWQDKPLPAYDGSDSGLAFSGPCQLRKTRDILIDLGGIAKGYAVDQAIDVLAQQGIVSACVNAGGDVRVLGTTPFLIGIRDPANLIGTIATIDVADGALATSASYFSQRQAGSQTVSALLDGRSGQAIVSPRSTSVWAPTCMLADALTKVVHATADATHPLLAHYGAHAFLT